jgi:hypothetical protein
MIVSGFTINARRAGITLAMTTDTASAIGAASHTHKAGELLPAVIQDAVLPNNRDNASDPPMPTSVPAQASRPPSLST